MRMHVFELAEETFAIRTRICVYFLKQKASANLQSKRATLSVQNKK